MEQKKILVVDDEIEMRIALQKALEKCNFLVEMSHNVKDALGKIEKNDYNLIITDMTMPKQSGIEILNYAKEKSINIPIIMITAYGTIPTAVDAIKKGAFDFIEKPFDFDILVFLVERALSAELPAAKPKITTATNPQDKYREIISNNKDMQKILKMAKQVAQSNSTVLIEAESGTGKELLARYLHYYSDRRDAPLVAVNCAALPDSLLESELFGHKKGSFTGAISDHKGKFELANGGTIFLDEISEMEIALQAKLLRVLQEKTITRIGDSKEITLDIRVIATTNKSLLDLVEQNKFREDLYFRLNVIPMSLPPLRERKDDIDLLAEHFMKKYSKKNTKINPKTRKILNHYHWRGNIRELENVIERAVILCQDQEILPENLLMKNIS
jgi:DNA-binding NtrC family response regulator